MSAAPMGMSMGMSKTSLATPCSSVLAGPGHQRELAGALPDIIRIRIAAARIFP